MSKVMSYITCFGWLPLFLMGLLGLLLGWLLFGKLFGAKHDGDLTVEGEGALRAEADGLRGRIQELEGRLSSSETEAGDLRTKLAAAGTAAAAGAAAASLTGNASADASVADDETYALEWRNRYLAARVKYLEGRLAEAPKVVDGGIDVDGDGKADVTMPAASTHAEAESRGKLKKVKVAKGAAAAAASGVAVTKLAPKKKKAPAKKKAVKKPAVKKAPVKKAAAKKAAAPKVLYTDGPTDGAPDDLKLIKGIGPKFEGDLNGKGIYYFRQIAAWKKKDVELVENIIDSIPGRIERDEWVPQAKGLAKGGSPRAMKSKKKPGPKAGSKKGSTNKDGTPRKKPGPKATAAASKAKGNDKYYEGVLKFDADAKRSYVDNIVKYCGISLRSRDASLVACSDPTELDTIVKGFCKKKLDLDADKAAELVKATCEEMKGTRFKNRVTFYYLLSKRARKLSVFA